MILSKGVVNNTERTANGWLTNTHRGLFQEGSEAHGWSGRAEEGINRYTGLTGCEMEDGVGGGGCGGLHTNRAS